MKNIGYWTFGLKNLNFAYIHFTSKETRYSQGKERSILEKINIGWKDLSGKHL